LYNDNQLDYSWYSFVGQKTGIDSTIDGGYTTNTGILIIGNRNETKEDFTPKAYDKTLNNYGSYK